MGAYEKVDNSRVKIRFYPKQIATKGFLVEISSLDPTYGHIKSLNKMDPGKVFFFQDGCQNHMNLKNCFCGVTFQHRRIILVFIPRFMGSRNAVQLLEISSDL